MAEIKYTRQEQETTITWDAEDRTARIYSADPVTMRKLDKLAEEFPEVYKIVWTEDGGKARKDTVDSAMIRFKKPSAITEEQRERMRVQGKERMAAYHASRIKDSSLLNASAHSVE